MQKTTVSTSSEKQRTYSFWMSVIFTLVLTAGSVAAYRGGQQAQLWSLLPALPLAVAAFWFSARANSVFAGSILIAAVGTQSIMSPLLESGTQPQAVTIAVAMIGLIGLLALPRRLSRFVLLAAMLIGGASIFAELFASPQRPAAAYSSIRWGIAIFLTVLLVLNFGRVFLSLNIRTKIVLGILAAGGIAIGIFSVVVTAQTQRVTNTLSVRLESTVSLLAEEQLVRTIDRFTQSANQAFDDVRQEVEGLSLNWIALQTDKTLLSRGDYWNGETELVRLAAGQYGNSTRDPSSVYVPSNLSLNEELYADINTSAYLDFYAPSLLQSNRSLLAVYAIDVRGITRYYPNINLAAILPRGFDATQRPYYVLAAPAQNPTRRTRWTAPYVDATGGGLVVTVVSPVYVADHFSGVVAVDMQLGEVTKQVEALKVGETGYAFMIDDAGRVLSMPQAGFKLFGLDPQEANSEDFLNQSLFDAGSPALQAIVRRMAAGGNGLAVVNVDGVDTYISYSPIRASSYSLALVVPVSELQGAIITAREETQSQLQLGIRLLTLTLVVALFLAVLISLAIGQAIAAPVVELTGVANQIVAGDLGARASITSGDEIGALSEAFNTMTARLRASLQDLEQRVEERTAELARANERNERRAKQFEAIAQIAATISSTSDLDTLLPQITTAISNKLGFYHAGIFLLDSRKEYAVLSAANSEGGYKMLARNHRLRVGETGIVGYVTSTGKARVALNTGQDSVFFNNPDLPETRSEIALPLRARDEIIGALDVQSTETNAFTQEDINILITLADQVSIAIQNSRQFEETRKALAESVASARQLVRTGWQQFTKNQKIAGIRHSGAKTTILYTQNGNGQADHTTGSGSSRTNNRGISLSIPVKLRGEVIGTVDVRSSDNRRWDQDELDIVTAILERAAIAMENARLIAESQKRAAKERTIGEISAKISAQSDIDELLRTAAQELNRTLPGAEIAIQFHGNQEME